jgi:hypothetical protein
MVRKYIISSGSASTSALRKVTQIGRNLVNVPIIATLQSKHELTVRRISIVDNARTFEKHATRCRQSVPRGCILELAQTGHAL